MACRLFTIWEQNYHRKIFFLYCSNEIPWEFLGFSRYKKIPKNFRFSMFFQRKSRHWIIIYIDQIISSLQFFFSAYYTIATREGGGDISNDKNDGNSTWYTMPERLKIERQSGCFSRVFGTALIRGHVVYRQYRGKETRPSRLKYTYSRGWHAAKLSWNFQLFVIDNDRTPKVMTSGEVSCSRKVCALAHHTAVNFLGTNLQRK